jgi:hypothetical protein
MVDVGDDGEVADVFHEDQLRRALKRALPAADCLAADFT